MILFSIPVSNFSTKYTVGSARARPSRPKSKQSVFIFPAMFSFSAQNPPSFFLSQIVIRNPMHEVYLIRRNEHAQTSCGMWSNPIGPSANDTCTISHVDFVRGWGWFAVQKGGVIKARLLWVWLAAVAHVIGWG